MNFLQFFIHFCQKPWMKILVSHMARIFSKCSPNIVGYQLRASLPPIPYLINQFLPQIYIFAPGGCFGNCCLRVWIRIWIRVWIWVWRTIPLWRLTKTNKIIWWCSEVLKSSTHGFILNWIVVRFCRRRRHILHILVYITNLINLWHVIFHESLNTGSGCHGYYIMLRRVCRIRLLQLIKRRLMLRWHKRWIWWL